MTTLDNRLDENVNTIINGNILPYIHSNYDIGSSDKRWGNIYLSDELNVGWVNK